MRRFAFPLAIGTMLLMLAALSVWTAAPAAEDRALSVRSTEPDGARALWLWLGEMGFEVRELTRLPFAVDPDADLLFVLGPRFPPVSQSESKQVAEWVQAGGTLVVALDALAPGALLDELDIGTQSVDFGSGSALPAQPLFTNPPVRAVQMEHVHFLDSDQGELVPLLARGGQVVAAERVLGQGRVVVVGAGHPFSNEGLGQSDNAALVLNLARSVPPGAVVVFDEVHHGLGQDSTATLLELLARSPIGRAVLYALLLTFAYLALRGRRFGRVQAPFRHGGRSAGEYVAAMASLYRRAGRREFIAQHFERDLHRRASRAVGLQAGASAAELAARFKERKQDPQALFATLSELRRERLSEADLLRLVEHGEAQLQAMGSRGTSVRDR